MEYNVSNITVNNDRFNFGRMIVSLLFAPFYWICRMWYRLCLFFKANIKKNIILLCIISIFFIIKLPYMNTNFFGRHNMKYSTYIQPALNMVKNGFYKNELKYLASPLFDGNYDTIGALPLLPWLLALSYTALDFIPIELSTRILMLIIGILILINAYNFFLKFLPQHFSIFITSLIAINPIFQFDTFLTVNDSLLLLGLFFCSNLLYKGILENKIYLIVTSGIIAGIFINVKYSALLFYTPIFFGIIFLLNNKKIFEKFSIALIFTPQLLLQSVFFLLSLSQMPSKTVQSLFLFFIFMSLNLLLIVLSNNYFKFILYCFRKYRFKLIFLFFFITSILFFIIINTSYFKGLSDIFLSDDFFSFLRLRNYDLIISRLKSSSLGNPIYNISLFFFIFIFFVPKKMKYLCFSFIISSLIYLAIAKRAITAHDYYDHIIVISFIVIFSCILYYMFYRLNFNSNFQHLLLVSLFCIILFNYIQLNKMLGIQLISNETKLLVVNYINQNMKYDELILLGKGGEAFTSLGIYTNKKTFFEDYEFVQNKALVDIMSKDLNNNYSLKEIFIKYKIKYYVNPEPVSLNDKGIINIFKNFKHISKESIWESNIKPYFKLIKVYKGPRDLYLYELY